MSRRCVACVSYYTPGWGESTRVVEGISVCDAACRALEAFRSAAWHGPRPGPDTWLEVTVVGSVSRPHWVKVSKALELWERDAPKNPPRVHHAMRANACPEQQLETPPE